MCAEVRAQIADHVVINEVFYDALSGWPEPQAEWIELYNPTDQNVDLSGWRLTDDPDPGGGNEGAYAFPPGALIYARSYLIIANNGLEFKLRNGFYPHYEISDSTPDVPDLLEVNPGLSLANAGDDIRLFDSSLNEVDSVWYGSPTDGDADPTTAAPDVAEGHSIEREPQGVDTNVPAVDFVDRYPPTPMQVFVLTIMAVDEIGRGTAGVPFEVDGNKVSTGASGAVDIHLPAGTHSVAAPTSVRLGKSILLFLNWSDGNPNDDRTVTISSDTMMTAVFSNVSWVLDMPKIEQTQSSLKERIRDLAGRVEALNNELSNLTSRIDELESSIDLLKLDKSKFAAISSEISCLTEEVINLSLSISQIKAELEEIKDQMQELGVSLTAVEELQERIQEVEEGVSGLRTSFSELASRLQEFSDRISQLEERPEIPAWTARVSISSLLVALVAVIATLTFVLRRG